MSKKDPKFLFNYNYNKVKELIQRDKRIEAIDLLIELRDKWQLTKIYSDKKAYNGAKKCIIKHGNFKNSLNISYKTPKDAYNKSFKEIFRISSEEGFESAKKYVDNLYYKWAIHQENIDKKAYDGAKKALKNIKNKSKDFGGLKMFKADKLKADKLKADNKCMHDISVIINNKKSLISTNNIWNAYSLLDNSFEVVGESNLRKFKSGWNGIASIRHKNKGYGYIESSDGGVWNSEIYSRGSVVKISGEYGHCEVIAAKHKFLEIKKIESTIRDPDFKIVVPIPAFGRASLLRYTIRRLKRQSLPIYKIIVMGCEEEVKEVAEDEGAIYIEHKNLPLGLKWQHGMDISRQFNPDAVLMLGSSDWISDDWCAEMSNYIIDGFDLIGKRKMMFLDVGGDVDRRLVSWNGYTFGEGRACEPIGAGRLFSRKILDKINWKIYNVTKNNNMDFTSMNRIINAGGKVGFSTDLTDSIMALSLSFPKLWGNLHGFDSLCNPKSNTIRIKNCDSVMNDYFPNAIDDLLKILKNK